MICPLTLPVIGQYELQRPDLVAMRKKNREKGNLILNGNNIQKTQSDPVEQNCADRKDSDQSWRAPLFETLGPRHVCCIYGGTDNIYSTEHIELIVTVQGY